MSAKLTKQIRRAFAAVRLHEFVPEGLAKKAEQFAYLHRMSKWIRHHTNLDHGYEGRAREGERQAMFARILQKEKLDGPIDYLEFGVADGTSFKWWATHNTDPASTLTGFDTFTALSRLYGRLSVSL